MDQLLMGGIAVAWFFAGLFFFRFWVQTRDRFFLYFSFSLWIESALRVALGVFPEVTEATPFTYAVRIVAYGLILLAIYQKNRPGS